MCQRSRFPKLFIVPALLLSAPAAFADIVWTGAVSTDIFDEANWDLTGSTVTVVDPNVTIDDNVVIANHTAPVEIPDVSGQARFQIGSGFKLTLDNALLRAIGNDGVGGQPVSPTGPLVEVVNGGRFEPWFINNKVELSVGAGSFATFGGGANPIVGSTVDLTATATLAFTDETVADYIAEHLSKTTVNGAPAVVDGNIKVVSDGAAGSIITVIASIGTNYCGPAISNSSGGPAVISAMGQVVVTANDLKLTAATLPMNELGYFLCSETQGFIANPGGSQGNLCLGGKIGRFVQQVQNSGSTGSFTITVDLTVLPVWPNQPVLPGETWNFQAWFKDGTTSNFTDGVSVTFQ